MSTTQPSEVLWETFQSELSEVSSPDQIADIRDRYLSRQRGLITLELKKLGQLAPEQRPVVGQMLNQLKIRVEARLEERQLELNEQDRAGKLQGERVDVTLPGYSLRVGRIHPLRKVRQEMEEIFVSMGFTIVSGPEVEDDFHNFEALNMPPGHPARDSQDTLYITGAGTLPALEAAGGDVATSGDGIGTLPALSENLVLRTHTSPVQIRTMMSQKPPVRIIVPGRVFRRDAVDATHSPMFHQLEGLVVDEGITLADLKGTLEVFFKTFFSQNTTVRLRPSFFPFVEPGAEMDVSCIFCSGKGCSTCKQSGWIEILGAGMVHPRVLETVGYDCEKYTGFAWGMGIDRIAQLKYDINDMRLLFENDLRFLSQF